MFWGPKNALLSKYTGQWTPAICAADGGEEKEKKDVIKEISISEVTENSNNKK